MSTLADLFCTAPTPIDESSIFTEAGIHDPNLLKAIFVVGAAGSGKSSIAKTMFSGRGLKFVDQDKHLQRFLSDRNVPLSKVGDAPYKVFKKAQGLAHKERDAYARQRLGLIIDSTGWDYPRVEEPVKKLRELGYDCYLIAVTVSLETAMKRNWDRGQAGGRLVPKHAIRRTFSGLERNLPKYVRLFGHKNTTIISNDTPIAANQWKTVVAPALARAGDKILAKPIKNAAGRDWLDQLAMRPASEGFVEVLGDVSAFADRTSVRTTRVPMDEGFMRMSRLPSGLLPLKGEVARWFREHAHTRYSLQQVFTSIEDSLPFSVRRKHLDDVIKYLVSQGTLVQQGKQYAYFTQGESDSDGQAPEAETNR